MPAEAIIIGAGIAGASAAYELAKVVPVIILEREFSLGITRRAARRRFFRKSMVTRPSVP